MLSLAGGGAGGRGGWRRRVPRRGKILFFTSGVGGGIVGFSSGRATGNLALRREDVFAFWCAHRTRLGA